ncbi:MAG: purine-nucleoside phosphorylase [Candidatus Sericytochromatia bacterium]
MLKILSDKTINFVSEYFTKKPVIAVVLGSGVKTLENLDNEKKLSYADIPDFPQSTVAGHAGLISVGDYKGVTIAVLRGRFHKYEGHSWKSVITPIALMKELGVKDIILTNAAGGINRIYKPGDLMLIEDHINMQPLDLEERENLSKVVTEPRLGTFYNKKLCDLAVESAIEERVLLHQGIYLSLSGPSYETRAEILMFRKLNVDAVGMSTVPEAVWGTILGLNVLGISCITNSTYYEKAMSETSHQEVIDVAKKASENIDKLIKSIILKVAT